MLQNYDFVKMVVNFFELWDSIFDGIKENSFFIKYSSKIEKKTNFLKNTKYKISYDV